MRESFETANLPKICYVFGELSGGGHNLQAYKTIIYSGSVSNCIVVSIFKNEDESLERLLGEKKIKLYKLDLGMKGALTSGIKALKDIVYREGCSIVHSNGLKADTLCHFAFQNTKVQHIITLHNYLKEDVYLRKGKLYSLVALRMQSHVLSKSKYIIACSKTLQKQMQGDNPKLKITAIQNGVDIERFVAKNREQLRSEWNIASDTVIFISTGRMSPRKRITETADAFLAANLDQKYQLWFIGNGECFEEYQERYRNDDSIKFLGRRNDIPDLLNLADIFVSSSESEGLPLAVLEALATGKKVFLSDIPPHKEILDDFPKGGALYHLGDKAALMDLFRDAQEYLISNDKVSIQGTSFDIRVMGMEYAWYYKWVEAMGKET